MKVRLTMIAFLLGARKDDGGLVSLDYLEIPPHELDGNWKCQDLDGYIYYVEGDSSKVGGYC